MLVPSRCPFSCQPRKSYCKHDRLALFVFVCVFDVVCLLLFACLFCFVLFCFVLFWFGLFVWFLRLLLPYTAWLFFLSPHLLHMVFARRGASALLPALGRPAAVAVQPCGERAVRFSGETMETIEKTKETQSLEVVKHHETSIVISSLEDLAFLEFVTLTRVTA